MRKFACLLLCLGVLPLAACGWIGRTSGKTVASVQNGAENLTTGYKEGYREKRAKEQPRPIPRHPDENYSDDGDM